MAHRTDERMHVKKSTCLAIPTRDLTAVERSRDAMGPVKQKVGREELS